jgi:hypothetical protein
MLTPAALIDPVGPLETRLFPGEDAITLTARVQAYLDAGYADSRIVAIGDDTPADAALQDQMARAYALWRAYDAVYQRMLSEPLTVNVAEKGGHGYSTAQIDGMQARAEQYLAELNALIPVPISTTTIYPGTTSVPTLFRW